MQCHVACQWRDMQKMPISQSSTLDPNFCQINKKIGYIRKNCLHTYAQCPYYSSRALLGIQRNEKY